MSKGQIIQEQDLEQILVGINDLINQRDWAQQAQQQTETERDNWKTRAEQAEIQLNKHVDHFCSHTDYEEIKQQRDNYQQQVQTANQESQQKEQAIIHQINQDLHLNLKEPNLEQLITTIHQLIQKPPQTIYEEFSNPELEKKLKQTQQTIFKLEQENNTPFGEDLAVIKQLELTSLEELFKSTVDTALRQEIHQATSYAQVVAARQAFLAKQLEPKQNKAQTIHQASTPLSKPPKTERIILIGLLVVSLLTIGGLLTKIKGTKNRLK
jgi:hypothetical protein